MKIRRFQGATTREVLAQIRSALGDEAVILSNREAAGGVEIVAAVDFDDRELQAAALAAAEQTLAPAGSETARRGRESPQAADAGGRVTSPAPQSSTLGDDLQNLRQLVEKRWGQRQKKASAPPAALEKNLSQWGFSLQWLERHGLPKELTAAGMAELVMQLEQLIPCLPVDDTDGGLFALLGPTGAGKTTTIAKLAARRVLRHGPHSVALFTTDTYRIAGVEQLGIYARILGVPLEVIHDAQDLLRGLQKHEDRPWIFIDTMGLSPRDPRLREQLDWLEAVGPDLHRYLLLPAGLDRRGLGSMLAPYEGLSLSAAILSKLDEAPACGAALEWLQQRQLPLAYFSDGQKVPEDLHEARWSHLLASMGVDPEGGLDIAVADRSRYHDA
ncbi:MAG: flagellar biosynthesis protein FlhF [Acidithiobacillus sp.]